MGGVLVFFFFIFYFLMYTVNLSRMTSLSRRANYFPVLFTHWDLDDTYENTELYISEFQITILVPPPPQVCE